MQHIKGLRCLHCGALYPLDHVQYVCPQDGANLDVEYDYSQIRREALRPVRSMWRYKALLPLPPHAAEAPLPVGDTPLISSVALAQTLGLRAAWMKDEGRNPTASLKDRASAMVIARALADAHLVVTTASTGNAAAALAGLAASVGMPSVIFVPASAPVAKITQLVIYGAQVLLVDGSYDQAFDLCLEASERFGWYCRNTGYNPYTREGKKTVAYEIAESLSGKAGEFHAPDVVLVSVGDGNIISGVHKGFRDLLALEWIEHMPRIIGVQAEGSAALHAAWASRQDPHQIAPVEAKTIADSISAGLPRDPIAAIRAVAETNGAFLTVSDEEILSAIPALARLTGVFAEPAAAAGFAGALKAAGEGLIGADDEAVLLLTGSGLKDIATAQRAISLPAPISPRFEAVEAAARSFPFSV